MEDIKLTYGVPPEVTVYHIDCVDEFGKDLPQQEYYELVAEILSMHVSYGTYQNLTDGEGITIRSMKKLLDKVCEDTNSLPCKSESPKQYKGRIHEKPFHHKGRW